MHQLGLNSELSLVRSLSEFSGEGEKKSRPKSITNNQQKLYTYIVFCKKITKYWLDDLLLSTFFLQQFL